MQISENYFSEFELLDSVSPTNSNGVLFNSIFPVPIYLIFKAEGEKFVYTWCGVLEIFKKHGLVDEALGNLMTQV